MSKIVGAFIGRKCLEKLADEFAERIDGWRYSTYLLELTTTELSLTEFSI
jgi:hypothetical protein